MHSAQFTGGSVPWNDIGGSSQPEEKPKEWQLSSGTDKNKLCRFRKYENESYNIFNMQKNESKICYFSVQFARSFYYIF